MKRKSTYKKWAVTCLLFLLCIPYAHAQYPKLLGQYPVVTSSQSGINAFAQKGAVMYLGGDFSELGQKPVVYSYGFAYDQLGAASPNPNFAVPHGPNQNVSTAIPDGEGGFYIFSDYDVNFYPATFTKVNGVDRSGIARINADGSLNDWGAGVTVNNNSGGFSINTAVKVGNTILVGVDNGNATGITALDATSGQPLSGWESLALSSIWVHKMIVSGNKLYVLANDQDYHQTIVAAIDISDITHPSIINTFKLDAKDPNGGRLSIVDMVLGDNTLYLTGYNLLDYNFSSSDLTKLDYPNQTLSGQAFNSALFAIDATTGTFIKAFTTPLTNTDFPGSLALDGNKLYFAYHSGTSGKLIVFDTQTGADLSTELPAMTMTGNGANPFGGGQDVPYFNYNKLTVTTDRKLIIYGGFTTMNGTAQTAAALDLASNTLMDWHPLTTVSNSTDANTYIGPTTIAESNGHIYMGGSITLQSATTVPNVTRQGLAAIDAQTGEVLPWSPTDLIGTVNAMSISRNTLYVGGQFYSPNSDLQNLAAYDITDPANPVLVQAFMPIPDDKVNALAVSSGNLYVGGAFQNIGTSPRSHLAAFDVSNGPGALTSWDPGADDIVNTFLLSGDTLYTGGYFMNIGTTARSLAAAFNIGSTGNGSLTVWNPQISFSPGYFVNAFAVQAADGAHHNARIFIGGNFAQIGAGSTPVRSLAVTNTTDGALDAWQFPAGLDDLGGQLNALTIVNNKLYGGSVNYLTSIDVASNFAPANADVLLTNVTPFSGIKTILTSNNLLFAGGNFVAGTDATLSGLAVYQTGDITPVLTFADVTKTYGDVPFAPAATSTVAANPVTYSIAAGDNNDNVISLADGKITLLKPGVATITASQTGATDVKAKITVNKAVLTISPKDAATVVNQPFPDFPFTLTGWENGDDTKTGIYTGKPAFTSTATESSPAGTYELSVSGAGSLVSDYYTFTASTDKAVLTINATGSTQQAITFGALPAKTYGDADFALNATTSASGLTVTYKSSNENIATITNGALHIMSAGTVTITASQAGNPTYAPAADVPQTLTIAKAALTIKADDMTRNRGDANPAFTATYTGLVNGDTPSDLTTPPAFSTTATQTSTPGTYPISVAGAASGNYDLTYENGTLTIKGTQIITFAPLSTLTYGDAPFDPGATSDAGVSFTPVYTTSNPSVIAISGGQAVVKGAGTATITATFAAAGGFELTTATLPVMVLPKALTATADDKTQNYGDPLPPLIVTYNGFVNNDTYTTPGVFSTPPVVATTATATSPVGTYPITVSGGVSVNYTLTYYPGTLTINAIARTITFNTIAGKMYGDADFNPGATSNTGEQVTYTVADAAVATVTDNGQIHLNGAGSTTITATLPANGSYTGVTTATQALTVAKAALTITADSKTRSQGPPDILLTATYDGFVGSDNQLNLTTRPVLATTAQTSSPTGTYPITISGASSPNYDITYVNGTLTILPDAGTDHTLTAWCSSPSTLEIKVYVSGEQKAAVQLFSMSGQRLVSLEKQLSAGLNQYQVDVSNLPAGIYIVRVLGTDFNLKQQVKIK